MRWAGAWRVDETYVKVNGQWKYLYRAADKAGNTVDSLLRAEGDLPERQTRDHYRGQERRQPAALEALNAERPALIKVRQNKCLKNIIGQDHRAVKRITKPMMGFKDFRCGAHHPVRHRDRAYDPQGADA